MENQEIMDQFLENRQNYMMDNNSMQHMNVNVASAGCDAVVGVQGEVGGVAGEILGVKYDEHHEEHDVGDDDELKYVKEVQQSEKQQQLQTLKNFGLDDDESNELAEKETTNKAAYDFGNGDGGFVFGGDHHQHLQQHHDLFNIGNGHDTNGHDNAHINEDYLVSTGFEEKLNMMDSEMDGFKNETDFSSTSNVTESVEGFVPQVDVKIETKAEQHEMVDEEEPSSLATNTTNGTSSLSENVSPQAVAAAQANDAFDDFISNLENKENSDPLISQRPNELDLDQAHSQLNPDAKEFIPSFGSNPASPTAPFGAGLQADQPELSDAMETQMYFGQAPTAVPRHLLGDDDFVAQSPRKGKGDNNMDTVAVPKELSEFEQEADKRPHELEAQDLDNFQQRDEVMTPDQAVQQLPLDDQETQDKENQAPTDSTDFQPSNFMDHGPETCVDLDTDLDLQQVGTLGSLQGEDDVMKRSMYVASDDAIEDVLNSVQPIPTEIDSVNNSFIEELATESAANQLAGDKELLQVEEKEHVSHSPSTEEIQLNLQNALNSSNKDISQLPIDMDNANNMQESMYMEQEQHSEHQQEEEKQLLHDEQHFQQELCEKPQLLQEELQHQGEQHLQEELHHEGEQQHFQEELHHEGEQQHFQEEFQQDKQIEPEHQFHEEMHFEQKQPQEEKQYFEDEKPIEAEQHHFQEEQQHFDQLPEEPQQQLFEQQQEEQSHQDKFHFGETPQDTINNLKPTETAEESLLAETTNPLMANDSFMDKSLATSEQQQEIKETAEVFSSGAVKDVLNIETFDNEQQPTNFDDVVMSPSSTTDEKHLLEETKEQQLFSMSGLEQQMSEMMLNNSDGHLSKAEEVAATTATTAIEDISENLVSPDEAENLDQYHHQQAQQHQEFDQTHEQMLVDDSFNRHEQECQEQHEQEQQQQQHEMAKEMEIELLKQAEPQPEPVQEIIESPIEHKHEQELESEMVAVEEPIIEAKQAAPLFNNDVETENVTKTEEIEEEKAEEKHELPPCMVPETAPAELLLPTSMVPETAPAELLEPPMDAQNETEIVKKNEIEEEKQQTPIKEPIIVAVKEELAIESAKEVKEEESEVEVNETAEVKPEVPVEAVAVAATAALAATAAVAEKVASSPSKTKTEAAKKPLTKTTTTTAKPKVGSTPAAKKPVEAAKKPVVLAAKPRTAPAKPAAASTEKKPIAKTTTTTTSTAARKPLSATTTTASKVAAKTTTTTSATRTAIAPSKTTTTTRPTTAPRTVSSTTTTARKPATSTNGPLAKPRPTTAPAKPTTLGLSATNGAPKPKPTSPRSTLTSQVRKPTPSKSTGAKSPVKSTATTNGVAKTATTSLASKTKTTTSTVSSTAGKTFTARPAPKFTSNSSTATTTTTARRLTVGGSTAATTTTTTTKTSSTPLRKSSPTKPAAARTPTKSAGLKSKAPAAKTASPPTKPAPIRKPIDKATVTNGDAIANKELNGTAENITAPAEQQQAIPQNSDLQQAVQHEQQNGDASVPMQQQQQQQSFFEPRDEQIPMDLINA